MIFFAFFSSLCPVQKSHWISAGWVMKVNTPQMIAPDGRDLETLSIPAFQGKGNLNEIIS